MAPNKQALKNHEELFADHVSPLAVTDPELIEIFDNFAFDEVLVKASWTENEADGSVGIHDCVSGSQRVPHHAPGGAERWCYPDSSQRDSVSVRS